MAAKFPDPTDSRFCSFISESRRVLTPIQGFDELPLVSLQEAIEPLVPFVPQVHHMVWIVEKNYDESKDNLSKDETTSIMLYTLEWTPSKKSFYFILNGILRSQNRKELIPWFSYLRLFINAISKIPSSSHQMIYRGINMDLSNEYPEGKEFIWWSFTSCTSSLNVLEKYIGRNGTRTIFNIVCHSAKDISQYSCFKKEKEVLCYPARQFKVKSCYNTGNQLHIIHLEETEPKFPFFHIPQISTDNNSLQRRSIGSFGGLGFLYDINRDRILERLNMNDIKRSSQLYQTIQCQVINGNTYKNENLLKMIEMQDELRLSILLNLTPKSGIASLIDYALPIDKYTRFLYYSYRNREERLPNEISKIQECILPNTNATHIITGITLGIEFFSVLQLPSNDELAKKVDHVLDGIQAIFREDRKLSSLTPDDENTLGTIIDTKIYSNIPQLMEMTSLLNVCRCRNVAEKKDCIFRPLMYTLQPIQWLFPQYINSKVMFILLPSNLNIKLEQHLINLLVIIKSLKHSLDHHVIKLLSGYLQQHQQEMQNQWQNLKEMYENEVQQFRNLIFSIRIDQGDISKIDQALNDINQTNFKDRIKQLIQHVNDLEAKGRFINDLQQQQIRYFNVDEFHIKHDENEQSLERKLIIDDRRDRVLCSNDILNTNKQSRFNQLYHQLIQERQTNPHLNLIYADFSYCSFELHDIMIFPSNRLMNSMNTNKQSRPYSFTESQTSRRSSSSLDEYINILLLGEINVGKSTFINAFINYLQFKTFQQAESNKPIVLIPVSYSLLINNSVEEQIVSLSDFDHPGQSITQHCKSYVFHLNHHDGKKLRIINTPSFGDTQDVNQNNLNMEHILKYLDNFSYLNAVCFLFKSNTTQINVFFRTCLTQLFNFLGPTARKNLIFCFTNIRSNSFNSENTNQLLETTLNSFSMNDIPFKKDNKFCFDNESFRYLVALQHGVRFNDKERQQYEMSWSTSAIESNCLIDYIHQNLIPCRKYQSIKQAQFEIVPMIRPILETIRNTLRNMIIQNMNLTKRFIQLHPKAIHRTASMCLLCKHHVYQVNNFWIVGDTPHEIEETCYNCSCSSNQHIPMDYILEYELSDHSLDYNQYQMKDMLNKLCYVSGEFAFFLMYVACVSNDDPVCSILTRMINEENNLCLSQKPNHLNLQLVDDLKKIKNDYEAQINDLKNNHRYSTLPDIYKYIQNIQEYSMIREQMIAIKQGQEIIMKQYDYEVPNDLTDVSIYETTIF